MLRRTSVVMLTALTLGGVSGCVKNAATGERQLILMPKSQEVSLGRSAAQEVGQSLGLVDNASLQAYVSDMGKRLAATSERKDLPWSFQVVDDAAVNAFALPGGFIFITRGLMVHMENEAQLASVIGHEIGHVTGKHSVDQMSKAQVAQLGLGLGMVFSETFRQVGNIAGTGLGVLFLKFGREDEHQADELGLRYASRAGYDVRQMPGVFATLKRVSEQGASGGRVPEWLSTHPYPENRIERIESQLAKLEPAQKTGEVDKEGYLRRLVGMVYGPDPRQGFFKGDRFYHPEMKFQLGFPTGWKKQNTAAAVASGSPEEDAVIQLTLAKGTPEEAMRGFLGQQGIQAQPAARGLVQGLPSTTASFVAKTEQQEIAGLITFVGHAGKTFQILAITPAAKLAAYTPTFQQVHGSFAPVSDPAILNVQPARIELVTAPGRTTLADLYKSRPASVPVEELAVVNQMEKDTQLAPGQVLKWVQGGTPGATAATAAR